MAYYGQNAGNRRAFAKVAEFYQALQLGPEQTAQNPFFYLSNSPWNLHDLLEDFLLLNELPAGPMLLRDFGLRYNDQPTKFKGHKVEMLRRILTTYPQLPFILLGDSGEHDTDIYLTAAQEFPRQILHIYIRDVDHNKRAKRIKALIAANSGISVKLIKSYEAAIEHAREKDT
ncbi:MAG: App1 family protein [Lewinella sp.]|nr:App1 family protein [Lewinella sp.]